LSSVDKKKIHAQEFARVKEPIMPAILYAYHVTRTGRAVKLDPENYTLRPEKNGFVWLHFDRKDPATETFFEKDDSIDMVVSQNLCADDSRPRTIMHDGDILLNLRGVNLHEGSEPEDMIGIRFFVQDNRVVSIEKRTLKATGDIAERLQKRATPLTPGGFIAGFANALIDRMAPTITNLNEQVDELEEKIDQIDADKSRGNLSELRRDAIMLRRYLAPQRDALNTLSQQQVSYITADNQLRIREAADQATRVTEELEAIRERCAIVKDQLTDMRAEEMNRNMMILSVVAAIFLPLGLISGMFGINVGGMPWTEAANGFWWVTAMICIIGFVQLIIFKILKWI